LATPAGKANICWRYCFRFNDAFHQHLSGGVTDRIRDARLMHVHANILSVVHSDAPFRRFRADASAYFEKGAFFYNALTPRLPEPLEMANTGEERLSPSGATDGPTPPEGRADTGRGNFLTLSVEGRTFG
jgi:hypothetical protein